MIPRMRVALFPAALILLTALAYAGPLAEYVNKPDNHYTYSLASTIEGDGYKAHILDMTAQSWRDGDVTPHLWKHWVAVIVPPKVQYNKALLFITGGNNKHDAPPTRVMPEIADIAVRTNSVTAILQGVPSQPVTFAGESRTRSEDEIIAYTFAKYRDTGDPMWPLLLPMVKSAVRAMDSIQDFMAKQANPAVKIDGFVVSGASKRGWTTWLTAAVDRRVVAIAPMVIDVLNMEPQMNHQLACYGKYSEEINDYSELRLQEMLGSPEGEGLRSIVDPYSYRRKLTMPKLILLGSGDDYWTVDAAKFYFPGLRGQKYIRYEANAGHGLGKTANSVAALTAFHHKVLTGGRMPRFSWKISKDGAFKVRAKDKPCQVRVWKAYSDKRDFRMNTIGEAWKSDPLTDNGNGTYMGNVAAPENGYVAFFVELVYPSGLGFDYSLTTLTCVPERS